MSGQSVPTLSIPQIGPYVECLEWIQAEGLSAKYPKEDVDNWTTFEDTDPDGCTMLTKIETNECPMLKKDTEGKEAIEQVSDFVRGLIVFLLMLAKMAFLNSLVRICRTFGKEVDMGTPDNWPILSVEFTGFRYHCKNLPGPFTVGW